MTQTQLGDTLELPSEVVDQLSFGTLLLTSVVANSLTSSPSTGVANVLINNADGVNNAEVQFQSAGVSKWEMGKDASGNFFLYDDVAAGNALGIVPGAGGLVTWARPLSVSANVGTQLTINNPVSGHFSVISFTTNAAVKSQFYWDDTGGQFVMDTIGSNRIALIANSGANGGIFVLPSGGVSIGPGTVDPGIGALFTSQLVTDAHDTISGATGTVTKFVTVLNPSGTLTLTLPSAASNPGRWILLRHSNSFAVNSATSNVTPLGSTVNGTVIFPANAPSSWGLYQSDGTNWIQHAGNINNYASSSIVQGSAVSLTNNVASNVTSLSLGQGTWDVSAVADFHGTATTVSTVIGSVSTSSGALDSTDMRQTNAIYPSGSPFVNGDPRIVIGPARFTFSSTTTVFLVTLSAFSGGTATAYGTLRAMQIA